MYDTNYSFHRVLQKFYVTYWSRLALLIYSDIINHPEMLYVLQHWYIEPICTFLINWSNVEYSSSSFKNLFANNFSTKKNARWEFSKKHNPDFTSWTWHVKVNVGRYFYVYVVRSRLAGGIGWLRMHRTWRKIIPSFDKMMEIFIKLVQTAKCDVFV